MTANALFQNLLALGIIVFIFAMIYSKVRGESMFTMFKRKYDENKPKEIRRGI